MNPLYEAVPVSEEMPEKNKWIAVIWNGEGGTPIPAKLCDEGRWITYERDFTYDVPFFWLRPISPASLPSDEEIEKEKLLCDFFNFFKANGERFIGNTVGELVKIYLSSAH